MRIVSEQTHVSLHSKLRSEADCGPSCSDRQTAAPDLSVRCRFDCQHGWLYTWIYVKTCASIKHTLLVLSTGEALVCRPIIKHHVGLTHPVQTHTQVLLSKDAQLAESASGMNLPSDPLDLSREAAALDAEKAELLARLQQIEARQVEITRRLRSFDGGGNAAVQVGFEPCCKSQSSDLENRCSVILFWLLDDVGSMSCFVRVISNLACHCL